VDRTAERVGKNNAAFRRATERIAQAARDAEIEQVPFICECADPGCTEIVRLGLGEYERIRADSRLFLNAVGHEANAEGHVRVVSGGDGYVVVEKLGEAGEIADQLDPRTELTR
jgi:hypothetical protein